MQRFDAWWTRLRYSDAFQALPEWLREPPGLWIALGSLLLLIGWVLGRWLRGRRANRRLEKAGQRQLRQEIRDLKAAGDWRGVGQRYEHLGKSKAALDAYGRGGLWAEKADLLVRLGQRQRAKDVAREGEVWELFGELCEADGELGEAAAAYERCDQIYAAARCYEQAGDLQEAARCYQRAGMDARAIELLSEGRGAEAATVLEAAVRSSLPESGPKVLSTDLSAAVRRCCQLWLEEQEAQRAYRLALDTEQWELVVSIARDFLPPSAETAAACLRGEAFLPAAEIFAQLGDDRQEAVARGEYHGRREEPAESARWWEKAEEWSQAAEQWAAAGELEAAAQLFEKAGDLQQAADLHGRCGNLARQQELLQRLGGVAAWIQDPAAPTPDDFDDDPTAVMDPTAPVVRRPAAVQPVTSDGPSTGVPPTWLPTAQGRHPALPHTVGEMPSVLSPSDRRYVLKEELGRGGMGVVYRAEDLMLKRSVAYKMLPKNSLSNEGEAESLLAEARAAAQLSHPNIVQVYDAGRNADGFFIVMECVDGKDFSTLLAKRKLSVSGAVRVGRQICSALTHAHERRIIHRDLKPSNLMWTTDKQVKLTDFGLARAFEDSVGKVMTQPAGTPFYMAPEQLRGDPVEPLTDIYSFGCVLYELLCNSGPFGAGGSTMYHHLNSPPRDPRYHREKIPEALAHLVLRCLDKEPAKRPASAHAVGKELAAIAKGVNGPRGEAQKEPREATGKPVGGP